MTLKKCGLAFTLGIGMLAIIGCKGASQSKQNDFVATDASGNSYVMIKVSVTAETYNGPSNLTPAEKEQRIKDIKDPNKFNNKATCYYKAGPFPKSAAELNPYNPGRILRSGKATLMTRLFVNADDMVKHLQFWGTAKGVPAALSAFAATTLGGVLGGCGVGAAVAGIPTLGIASPVGCIAGGIGGGVVGAGAGIAAGGAAGSAAGSQSKAGEELASDKQFVEEKIDMKTFNIIADGITDYVNTKPNPYGFPCPFPTEVAQAADLFTGSSTPVELSGTKLDGTTTQSIETRKKLVLCIKKPAGISADDAKLDSKGCMTKYAPFSTGEKKISCNVDAFTLCLYGLNTAGSNFADAFTTCVNTEKNCNAQ